MRNHVFFTPFTFPLLLIIIKYLPQFSKYFNEYKAVALASSTFLVYIILWIPKEVLFVVGGERTKSYLFTGNKYPTQALACSLSEL